MPHDARRSALALAAWAVFLVALAVVGRLVAHWPNFTPVAAVALFSGFLFRGWLAWAVPLAGLVISDALIGFYDPLVMAAVYLGTLSAALIGRALPGPQPSVLAIGGGCLGSALAFFVISNLGVWLFSGFYPLSAEGLAACFVAAIPFFTYTLGGTLLFGGILFGLHGLLPRLAPEWAA